MVLANSTWVRPAQALVYSEESGEVRYFPPRNRGPLPRALTFGESHHQDCWSVPDQILSPFSCHQMPRSIQEEDSYFIASEMAHFHIDDPPEEYESFADEYYSHSIARDEDSYSRMDVEAPTMSTPTEQYVNARLQRRQRSTQSTKRQEFMTSASIAEQDCMSPLLQPDKGQCSSTLDELVSLYSKKLDAIRNAKRQEKSILESRMNGGNSDAQLGSMQDEASEQNQTDLELMAFDIQLLLDRIDEQFSGRERNSEVEEWVYLPSDQLESILMNCPLKRKEFVTID